MTRLFVRPPRRASQSARDIAFRTGARLIRRNNSRYRFRTGDRVINWGNPAPIDVPNYAVYNHPVAVALAIDKSRTWDCLQLHGVPTVDVTYNWGDARHWLHEGQRVMVRTALQSSQGRGITVYSEHGTEHTLPSGNYEAAYHDGAAYVLVFGRNPAHVTEYRVAVCGGQVIDCSQKKRRRDYEGRIDPYIRSYGNGWIFAREGVECPESGAIAAIDAVEALELDFGAVDIGVHRHGHACVYEVNTAPGIEGTSHERWAEALASLTAPRETGHTDVI